MKTLFTLITLAFSFGTLAQDSQTIDDLGTMSINADARASEVYKIHYPNYRMGGGNGAGRSLRDCLLLDIRHSDSVVSLAQKLKVARALKVLEGNGNETEKEMELQTKGNNVVFLMPPGSLYMTWLQALSRDQSTLNEILRNNLPSVRTGNGSVPPAGLVYVRDCRF